MIKADSDTETTCVVCPHILSHQRDVRLFIHHADGVWQATCGERDHVEDCSDFEVIGLNHLLDRQGELAAFQTLPLAHIAERREEGWSVSRFDEDNST